MLENIKLSDKNKDKTETGTARWEPERSAERKEPQPEAKRELGVFSQALDHSTHRILPRPSLPG
jgi:hypothetical protein